MGHFPYSYVSLPEGRIWSITGSQPWQAWKSPWPSHPNDYPIQHWIPDPMEVKSWGFPKKSSLRLGSHVLKPFETHVSDCKFISFHIYIPMNIPQLFGMPRRWRKRWAPATLCACRPSICRWMRRLAAPSARRRASRGGERRGFLGESSPVTMLNHG